MKAPDPALRTDEYCEGWHAFFAGVHLGDNPHDGKPAKQFYQWYDWRAGWMDAQCAFVAGN